MGWQGGKGARTSPWSGAEVELELEAQRQVNADILTSLEVIPPIHAGTCVGARPHLRPHAHIGRPPGCKTLCRFLNAYRVMQDQRALYIRVCAQLREERRLHDLTAMKLAAARQQPAAENMRAETSERAQRPREHMVVGNEPSRKDKPQEPSPQAHPSKPSGRKGKRETEIPSITPKTRDSGQHTKDKRSCPPPKGVIASAAMRHSVDPRHSKEGFRSDGSTRQKAASSPSKVNMHEKGSAMAGEAQTAATNRKTGNDAHVYLTVDQVALMDETLTILRHELRRALEVNESLKAEKDELHKTIFQIRREQTFPGCHSASMPSKNRQSLSSSAFDGSQGAGVSRSAVPTEIGLKGYRINSESHEDIKMLRATFSRLDELLREEQQHRDNREAQSDSMFCPRDEKGQHECAQCTQRDRQVDRVREESEKMMIETKAALMASHAECGRLRADLNHSLECLIVAEESKILLERALLDTHKRFQRQCDKMQGIEAQQQRKTACSAIQALQSQHKKGDSATLKSLSVSQNGLDNPIRDLCISNHPSQGSRSDQDGNLLSYITSPSLDSGPRTPAYATINSSPNKSGYESKTPCTSVKTIFYSAGSPQVPKNVESQSEVTERSTGSRAHPFSHSSSRDSRLSAASTVPSLMLPDEMKENSDGTSHTNGPQLSPSQLQDLSVDRQSSRGLMPSSKMRQSSLPPRAREALTGKHTPPPPPPSTSQQVSAVHLSRRWSRDETPQRDNISDDSWAIPVRGLMEDESTVNMGVLTRSVYNGGAMDFRGPSESPQPWLA